MLRILGSHKTLCDGLSRRDLLTLGTLGMGGFVSGNLLAPIEAAAAGAPPQGAFGRAKSCIRIYLFGAASQLETFDVKPQAPVEVRGELGAISTSVPGLAICEGLPHLAQVMDRSTVVRSMTHPYPIHGSAYSLTATPTLDIPMQLDHQDPRHWPFVGSVVEYTDERRRADLPPLPGNVALPWPLSSRRDHPSRNGGPYGAFLGSAYDPIWTEFEGEATRQASYEFNGKVTTCFDPYGGVKPGCRFELSKAATPPAEITLDRLDRRRSLLRQFNDARRGLGAAERVESYNRARSTAFSILGSGRMRDALDVEREPVVVRDRYGMTLFGQALLVARRLVEAGGRFVTDFWDEFASVNSGWDTHFQHYPRMKEQLLPGFDLAFSALITELEDRGLLDETLLVCTTEHGRTPRLSSANGGGRDHWSQAYCSLLAGGGTRAGHVVGRTDGIAGSVVERPVSPKDLLATMLYLLGVDPRATIYDRLGRPYQAAGDGEVVHELLA
ncbi:MAG TPA: DUF1501 domain-containing protein [Chloroflexota bacterium]|nr:DUF1501 domain-containing protein [Chloroflexota bacterium]